MHPQMPTRDGLTRNNSPMIIQGSINSTQGHQNSPFQASSQIPWNLLDFGQPSDLPPPQDTQDIQSYERPVDQDEQPIICMNCKTHEALFCCVPCGHKVLCRNCSDEISRSHQQASPQRFSNYLCPLCDTPVQCFSRIYKSENCCICKSQKADTVFFPCGHECVCYDCSQMIWEQKKSCPLCQQKAYFYLSLISD